LERDVVVEVREEERRRPQPSNPYRILRRQFLLLSPRA
jgi:hypothetical protein